MQLPGSASPNNCRKPRQHLFRIELVAAVMALGLFAPNAQADSIPTGLPPSPLFGATKFSQPMPRFDVLPRLPVSALNPAPTEQSNQTQHPVDPLARRRQPVPSKAVPRGRSGRTRARRGSLPQVAVDVTMEGMKLNTVYNPGVPASLNSGINPANPVRPALPPPDAGSGSAGDVDLQRHAARRSSSSAATASPSSSASTTACPRIRTPERRVRHPHHLDARAQRPPRRGERRLHRRVLLPGPVLRLPLPDRARRPRTASTPARPIRSAATPGRQRAAWSTCPATGTRR